MLIHFESAAYPLEARAAGIEADVVLRLTIDRDGNVTRADVARAAGHGFDEAAVHAASKFKFAAATRQGEPVAVRILYKYSFKLQPPPEAEPPPAREEGELSGRVRSANDDTPLVGADVIVVRPDGSTKLVQTNADGSFVLRAAPAGRYRVTIRARGFVEESEDVLVVGGEAVDTVYRPRPVSDEIEIVIEGERQRREVTRRVLARREIERVPGTGGDALRSLESLPGVARPPGLAGLLIVRGSAPEDTNVFVDGSLVPLVYHFGGLTSVIPTELLERIDFAPGNFSPRFGRVQGGIVDVAIAAPDTHCEGPYGRLTSETGCYHAMVQVDLIDTRLLVQGPIAGSQQWSFAVAGRRSWLDLWLKPVLEEAGTTVSTAPVYYDYQAILEYRKAGTRFSLRAYGSDDRLRLLVKDPLAQDPGFGGTLAFGTAFTRVQALYHSSLSPTVDLDAMLSVGKDGVDFSVGTFRLKADTYPLLARSELSFRPSPKVSVHAGFDMMVIPYDVSARLPDVPRPGEPSPGPFVTLPLRESRERKTAFRPGWYGDVEFYATKRLQIVPGLRVDYARDSGHSDVSPRLNARYDLLGAAGRERGSTGWLDRRTTLKGGVGVYAQPPQFTETGPVFGTPGLHSNRALHCALGLERELTPKIELGVEGFYKRLSDQVSRAPHEGGFRYDNRGAGSVRGIESLVKYHADKRFFGWLAYTLSRSERRDRPQGPTTLFQYDQTHNLTVLGSYRLGGGWEAGARFRVISGALTTPVVEAGLPAVFAADAGAYAPLQGAAFSRRLPLFHQLDLRVDKRWQLRHFRVSVYLDIRNVYNNAAVEALAYNYNFSQYKYQRGIPILPSLGVRGEL